ncbi:hypothetical protein ACWCYY_37125 [Kitasatospora sp. NPDC001664]
MTLRRPAGTAFLALALLYLAAVWTPLGQRAENALIVGYADGARILPAVESWGPPPLVHEYATLAAALTVIAVLTVARHSWREGAAAVLTVAAPSGRRSWPARPCCPAPTWSAPSSSCWRRASRAVTWRSPRPWPWASPW